MLRLNIKVIPNAKVNKLTEETGRIKVHLTAKAVDGKANQALIEFLAEHYKVRKSQVSILRGQKARDKVVEIRPDQRAT